MQLVLEEARHGVYDAVILNTLRKAAIVVGREIRLELA